MLGVLDQPKTLGLDPASPRPFRVRQRLEANVDSFRLEIEPEGVATSCAFAAGQWCSLFYLFSCRSVSRSLLSLGAPSNRWLLAGVAAMIVTQAAFSCMPFMNVAFHSPPLDAAAWLRVIGVALTASVIVGFQRRVRTQAEKSEAPDAHARALPRLS
jgi:magnesium-transporting ATPase (P-type)